MKPARKRGAKNVPKLDSVLLQRQYEEVVPTLKRLEDEGLFVVKEALAASSIKYHSVTSRIKAFKSLFEKAQRLGFEDPLRTMQDIVGLRIICLFFSDIDSVARVIRNSFEVIREDNKIDGQDVASFGYMSHHFVVRMQSGYSGPRYNSIAGLNFEIQVRTIAMEAWATASHYLDYKTETDVPKDLKKDFYALSGLFYVADRHFEMFFKARQQALERIAENKVSLDEEINLDSLGAYLRYRFPHREQPSDPSEISDLVGELTDCGYETLQQLEDDVKKHWKQFVKSEKTDPPSDEVDPELDTVYTAVGVIRNIYTMAHPDCTRSPWLKPLVMPLE